MRNAPLLIALSSMLAAPMLAESNKEVVYGSVARSGGEIVPMYDKGFLIYPHLPNRLQVFGPDTQVAFDLAMPCPGTGDCSIGATAVDAHGNVAVGLGYWADGSRAGGIRILNRKGQQIQFFGTSLYVPSHLAFDKNGDLWAIGWQRDSVLKDRESKSDYNLVRKFSLDGKLIGQYLPRSLWPAPKSRPGAGMRGYWTMSAANDRIGVLMHESNADNPPEWVEWDLAGKLISRTILESRMHGRAFTASGRLYAQFAAGNQWPVLKVLDTNKGTWTAVPDNLSAQDRGARPFLIGAGGDDLVYETGSGNLHLVWSKPGVR